MRIIPKTSKVRMTFYRNFTIWDVVIGIGTLLVLAITLSTNFPFRWAIAIGEVCLAVPFLVTINGQRLYECVGFLFRYLASRKRYRENADNPNADITGIVPYRSIKDGMIANRDGSYVGAIEISPIDFRMLSEDRQEQFIDGVFSRVLNSFSAGDEWAIVKLEKPLDLTENLKDELKRIDRICDSRADGTMTEGEYEPRIDLIQGRIELIDSINSGEPVYYSHYYLCLISGSKEGLDENLNHAVSVLVNGGMAAKRLDDGELGEFVEAGFSQDGLGTVFPELCPKEAGFSLLRSNIGGKSVSHFVINNYPLKVGNGWGEGFFDMESTKVVMKMRPVDKYKAIRRIDNSILEIETGTGSFRASDQIDRECHLETLQDLLQGIQNENETLFDTTVIISVYDRLGESTNRKAVRDRLHEMGFGFTEMMGRQNDAFITSMLSKVDKAKLTRGIQTSSIAACFPFVSNQIMDKNGILIGENRLPVFIDFFKRDGEFVNSNMVIMGKPGSGKSYAAKTIIAGLASEDTKVYVLDPEDEYGILAENLHGASVDVSSSRHGRINPFEIIGGAEEGESAFYSHLQFLEEFYRLILKGINPDSLELLNRITLEMYKEKGITPRSNLRNLRHEDYPTFDDLVRIVSKRLETEQDEYARACLKIIENYVSKFATGGRNSDLWDGYTTFSPRENFIAFDFQRLLANKNDTTANAQMLLVLRWLENEVMRNRELNALNGTDRRIVVAIDESHLFIDEKYPVALDFMYQLAKRIRKYNGMLIIITQNVKDFAGTPDIARKSSAIINVSQYSLIFSLSPNDMTELCRLYENAGAINEREKDAIVHNPRGRAFLISSPGRRSNVDIVATEETERMFQERIG